MDTAGKSLGHTASLGGLGEGCGSTPPVVPGAAPALAKAGVGGYDIIDLLKLNITICQSKLI